MGMRRRSIVSRIWSAYSTLLEGPGSVDNAGWGFIFTSSVLGGVKFRSGGLSAVLSSTLLLLAPDPKILPLPLANNALGKLECLLGLGLSLCSGLAE